MKEVLRIHSYEVSFGVGTRIAVRVAAVLANGTVRPILDDGSADSMEEASEVARDAIGMFADRQERLEHEAAVSKVA